MPTYIFGQRFKNSRGELCPDFLIEAADRIDAEMQAKRIYPNGEMVIMRRNPVWVHWEVKKSVDSSLYFALYGPIDTLDEKEEE